MKLYIFLSKPRLSIFEKSRPPLVPSTLLYAFVCIGPACLYGSSDRLSSHLRGPLPPVYSHCRHSVPNLFHLVAWCFGCSTL